ncbi:MAG: peptide-methionine (S)-S-oxide reductase MsrA [Myxococcales bacterium]|nr:peptide-methionine (S)-S-oxide reductase MsrA [Myxococcales bacterium]
MRRLPLLLIFALAAPLVACRTASSQQAAPVGPPVQADVPAGLAAATFAGGCFWCMEAPFDILEGVVSTTSGYTDGQLENPTYKQVSSGDTGHAEAIQVIFDPKKISYERLLDIFWHNIDPTQGDGQFCDHGNQYRTGIFFHDDAQKQAAEASKTKLAAEGKLPGAIVTQIRPATKFYPAEEYHQDFYKKNPAHYYRYRAGCGRDATLVRLWGESAGGKNGH